MALVPPAGLYTLIHGDDTEARVTTAGQVSSVGAAHPARRPLSKRRRRVFIALSLVFPLALVLVAEVVLRLWGFGGYPTTFRRVGTLADGSSLVITDNPGPASYFFANRSRPGTLLQSAFVMPKPTGTYRIVPVSYTHLTLPTNREV